MAVAESGGDEEWVCNGIPSKPLFLSNEITLRVRSHDGIDMLQLVRIRRAKNILMMLHPLLDEVR